MKSENLPPFEKIKNTIIELAKKHNMSSLSFFNDDCYGKFWEELEEKCGPITVADDSDGSGYDGEEIQIIWFAEDHNVYFSLCGTHSSWDSSRIDGFDELFEVEKKEITTKVWVFKE